MSDPARAPALGIEPEEAERTAAIVARLLPAALVPVFTPHFTRSHLLYDEFVHRLTLRVFTSAGFAAAAGDWIRAAPLAAGSGLEPRRSVHAIDWMLRHLAARGLLAGEEAPGGPRFRAVSPLPDLDPAEVRAEQRRHDPACLPSYALAETAARDYGAFLRGERTGEEILLAPARLPLWTGYFSNDNLLYAVNNRVGAAAVEAWMPGPAAILEVGGGLASGAAAVLEALGAAGRLAEVVSYRFTELVPAFLRRGQRLLQERFREVKRFEFGPLDMNRPFAEQGVDPGSVSIVYAVNTLHVAHDLAFTLAETRRALKPGGQLIISECVRPRPGDAIYPEFVFNLMEAFRTARLDPAWRPNGGFLTPEQWSTALEAASFADVRVMPDVARIRPVFPTFYVAAIGATRKA
jgi:SAM-dependent methyltransferase